MTQTSRLSYHLHLTSSTLLEMTCLPCETPQKVLKAVWANIILCQQWAIQFTKHCTCSVQIQLQSEHSTVGIETKSTDLNPQSTAPKVCCQLYGMKAKQLCSIHLILVLFNLIGAMFLNIFFIQDSQKH
jgi:hypothetical protein